jgi:cytochrome c oxidase subunit 2
MKKTLTGLGLVVILLSGCASFERFPAIPADLDRSKVQVDTVEVMARRYIFEPDEIHVKAGRLVVMKVTATDITHGVELPAFAIDERVEQGVTKLIEFYVSKPGRYDFKCSHFCGPGHFGMSGQVIAD